MLILFYKMISIALLFTHWVWPVMMLQPPLFEYQEKQIQAVIAVFINSFQERTHWETKPFDPRFPERSWTSCPISPPLLSEEQGHWQLWPGLAQDKIILKAPPTQYYVIRPPIQGRPSPWARNIFVPHPPVGFPPRKESSSGLRWSRHGWVWSGGSLTDTDPFSSSHTFVLTLSVKVIAPWMDTAVSEPQHSFWVTLALQWSQTNRGCTFSINKELLC